MPSARTIRALEALAARPGTAHEGVVARKKLAELRKKEIRTDIEHRVRFEIHTTHVWHCPCGQVILGTGNCPNHSAHERIREEIKHRFKKGDKVFYNYWAYSANCTATITGYVKPDGTNWAWIKVKFDHLKSGYRAIPIHSSKGWHLSHEPLPLWEAYTLAKP